MDLFHVNLGRWYWWTRVGGTTASGITAERQDKESFKNAKAWDKVLAPLMAVSISYPLVIDSKPIFDNTDLIKFIDKLRALDIKKSKHNVLQDIDDHLLVSKVTWNENFKKKFRRWIKRRTLKKKRPIDSSKGSKN